MSVEHKRGKGAAAIDWGRIHSQLARGLREEENGTAGDRSRQERILRDRAARLARLAPQARPTSAGSRMEVLVFQSAGERYALETAYVARVEPVTPITPVPGVPEFVVGIVPFQGRVLSVLDLRSLLDLPLSRLADPDAIIVLQREAMEFGILAESIEGVEAYASDALERASPSIANMDETCLMGIASDRTAILDAGKLLSNAGLVVDAG